MSKYHAKAVVVDGIRFASQKEAARYGELLLALKAGKIENLKLQPEFTITEGFMTPAGARVRASKYTADFSYVEDGREIVEDVKGFKTPLYLFKRKLLLSLRGVEVRET